MSENKVDKVVNAEKVWLIGTIINGGWMCEGVFFEEKDAANICKKK